MRCERPRHFLRCTALLYVALSSLSIILPTAAVAQQQAPTGAADAEQGDNTDIVVTGRNFLSNETISSTKLPQSVAETPQSISVLDAGLIKDLGLRDFTDAIRLVPGASVPGTVFGEVAIQARGYDLGRLNGYRINSAPTNIARPIDNIAVERIEFVRGGSGATFGEGGPGGYLNVVTPTPAREFALSVQAQAGSYDLTNIEGSLTGPVTSDGSVRFYVAGAARRSNSYTRFENAQSQAGYGNLVAELTPNITLSLIGLYNAFQVDRVNDGVPAIARADGSYAFPDYLPLDFNVSPPWAYSKPRYDFERATLDVKFSPAFNVTVIADRTRSKNPTALLDLCCGVDEDGVTQAYTTYLDRQLSSENAEVRLFGGFGIGGAKVNYIVTAEYSSRKFTELTSDYNVVDDAFDIRNPNRSIPDPFTGPKSEYVTSRRIDRNKIYSVSGLTSVDLTDRINVTGGVRYDKYNPNSIGYEGLTDTVYQPYSEFPGDNVAYRASATYRAFDKGRFYYSYSDSFEVVNQRTCDGRPLPPNTGRVHELGYKQQLAHDRLLLSAAVYDIRTAGGALPLPQNACPGLPPGTAFELSDGFNRSRGGEIELVGRILPNWNVIAGYSYTKTRQKSAGLDQPFYGVSPHQVSLYTVYDFDRGALRNVGLGGGFVYRNRFVAAAAYAPGQQSLYFDGQFRADLSAYYNPSDQLSLSLNVRNVLDAKQPESPFGSFEYQNRWREPRTFLVSLRGKM